MAKFKPGQPKIKGSGIQKGQVQQRTLIKRQVHDILLEANRHPVDELMKLIPQLSPKDASRVWLELLQYIAPKLSAQQVTVDDKRDSQEEPIDVTPKSTEELLAVAKEDE